MASSTRAGLHGSSMKYLDISHYDFVLAVIPVVFVVALLVGNLLSVAPRVALATASVVGLLAVVDALFLNPPTSRGN